MMSKTKLDKKIGACLSKEISDIVLDESLKKNYFRRNLFQKLGKFPLHPHIKG